MSPSQDLPERADDLVEGFPPGGLVVGLLPDPSDPEWAGGAALALALAAADRRKPALILDLAPEGTDLASRFDALDAAGIAELVDGEAELWEIVRRHPGGDAFYLPCGLQAGGADLARSPSVAALAARVRDEGRIALVPLDRPGAGEAASAGWVDGFVRLGEQGVSSTRLSSDVRVLGDLVRRDGDGPVGAVADPGADAGPDAGGPDPAETLFLQDSAGTEREPAERDGDRGSPRRGGSGVRMELRRRRSSSGLLRRAARIVVGAALLIAAGVTASAWLGGPGWEDVRNAAGAAAQPSSAEDSAAPAAADTAEGGAPTSG